MLVWSVALSLLWSRITLVDCTNDTLISLPAVLLPSDSQDSPTTTYVPEDFSSSTTSFTPHSSAEVSHSSGTLPSEYNSTNTHTASSHEPAHISDISHSTSKHSTPHRILIGGTKVKTVAAHDDSTHALDPNDSKYSWWKIVVTLVVFCVMAGIILWIVRCGENCKRRKEKSEEDLSTLEEASDSSNEKISTSKV